MERRIPKGWEGAWKGRYGVDEGKLVWDERAIERDICRYLSEGVLNEVNGAVDEDLA